MNKIEKNRKKKRLKKEIKSSPFVTALKLENIYISLLFVTILFNEKQNKYMCLCIVNYEFSVANTTTINSPHQISNNKHTHTHRSYERSKQT